MRSTSEMVMARKFKNKKTMPFYSKSSISKKSNCSKRDLNFKTEEQLSILTSTARKFNLVRRSKYYREIAIVMRCAQQVAIFELFNIESNTVPCACIIFPFDPNITKIFCYGNKNFFAFVISFTDNFGGT